VPRHARRAVLFLCLLGVLFLCASRARAAGWQEMHQSADDVRIAVGPDGVASIEHRLRFRIVAGRFKAFELAGVDTGAELVPETVIIPEKGGEIDARVEPSPKVPGTVRVVFDEPKKGLGRGVYLVGLRYRVDLVAGKLLTRDGALWKLTWTGPPAPEGRDGARVVFDLLAAPTEPRLAAPEQAATTLATLRRQPERDELELVRTHLPRGEAAVWSVRLDPRALPKIAVPELRPAAAPAGPSPPLARNHAPAVALAAALAGLAGLFAVVLRAKQAAVSAACAPLCALPRPLVPLPFGLGAFAYGAAVAAGLVLLLVGTPLHGALLVAVAMAIAVHRSPGRIDAPRGPGRWRAVADADVLLPRARTPMAGDALDLTTGRGRFVAAVVAVLVATAAVLVRAYAPGAAIAVPLAAVALVPVFVTGTRAQLPEAPLALAARYLRPARNALGGLVDLGHVELRCIARVRERDGNGGGGGGLDVDAVDEVRLACAPDERIPGVRSIELAVAGSALGAVPEVLVRFDDGSEGAAKVAALAPGVPVVPGRTPEEKVLRLAPTTPTAAGAAKLVARLLAELEGRRASDRAVPSGAPASSHAGPERRARRALTACFAAAVGL
jgi:hypothetical protein